MIRSPFLVVGALALATSASAQHQPDPAQVAAGKEKAQNCAACHGPGGNSQDPQYPNLAGQSWRYVYNQLKDFKEGRRSDPQMSPMAAGLSTEDMIALGNYYEAQKAERIKFPFDSAKVDAGRKIADAALCPMCHLGGFVGQNEIPREAGQWPQYIKKQLSDFRAKRRTNDAGNMASYTASLSDQDIESLSHYIGNLGP
ncbi:MAG TPA: c-type cytochrome [Casimicrobiaceae bacterium]|jgi:cytochrome c553|nr:c-type cytochrome [Casimicrobiaceae bacterium]